MIMDPDTTPVTEIDFGGRWPGMTTRIHNSLQRAGITTLGMLLSCTEKDLELQDEGLGAMSIILIKSTLRGHKLKLADRPIGKRKTNERKGISGDCGMGSTGGAGAVPAADLPAEPVQPW